MSAKEDLAAKLPVLTAIPDEEVQSPSNIPVDVYLQEAENLQGSAIMDQEKLTAIGLSMDVVNDIPVRAGALRAAETEWFLARGVREEVEQQWADESPAAYQLRDRLVHTYRFAYRDDPILTKKIKAIADGYGHADMIQDLNDLSEMGLKYPEPLQVMNFDITLLDEAAQTADRMASLLSDATSSRAEDSELKNIRDRAYTHLKAAVDEVRSYGQYVFHKNPSRLKYYGSGYLRRTRARREAREAQNAANASTVTQVPVDVDQQAA